MILGTSYTTNPRFDVKPWAWAMLRLWHLYRGGGMGVGILPEAGGSLDQSPYMLTCFGIMSEAEAAFKKDLGSIAAE